MVVEEASLAAIEPDKCDGSDDDYRCFALAAEGLQVKSRLSWRCPAPDGYVDFRYAHVHRLDDKPSAWTEQGKYYLTGLVYEELLHNFISQTDVKNRIDWLGRQPSYTSQPYEQLARFYRNSGHLRHASDVGVARERERLRNMTDKSLKTRFSWAIGHLYGWLVGFGYRPQNALGFLLILYVLTLAPLMWAKAADHISPSKGSEDLDVVVAQLKASPLAGAQNAGAASVPSGQDPAEKAPDADACNDTYPCYSTLLYSLETVAPLINLRQAEYWTLQADDLPTDAIRGWLGFSSILGWVLVTLIASTMLAAKR
jgi:hypothetical protein